MAVLLFVLWIILNGKITAEIIIIGLLVTIAVSFFAHKAIGYSPASDVRILRNMPVLALYVLNLILEIIRAALAVMAMIFQAEEPDPVIVEFHSGFRSNLQNVLLANSITLTPGTITLFQEEDHLVIHCLRREYAQGLENSSFVRILKLLK